MKRTAELLKAGFEPAPIDNKNIMEDYWDDLIAEFQFSNDKELATMWVYNSLFVIEYKYGSHKGRIKHVYGDAVTEAGVSVVKVVQEELEKINEANGSLAYILTEIQGNDVEFEYYFKPDAVEILKT